MSNAELFLYLKTLRKIMKRITNPTSNDQHTANAVHVKLLACPELFLPSTTYES